MQLLLLLVVPPLAKETILEHMLRLVVYLDSDRHATLPLAYLLYFLL